jgi:micrococcal nuclease
VTRPRAIGAATVFAAAITALVYLLYTHTRPLTLPALPSVIPGYYNVTRAIDGDTIEVSMNGKNETVRLIGVDTPETKKPNTPVQCYGPEASEYTKKTLAGKSVRLAADPLDDNRDRYGRLLRYVYLQDGTLLDETLVAQGYGFAYVSFPFQQKTAFVKAQEEARAAHRGLWAACTPSQSGERWQSNDAN